MIIPEIHKLKEFILYLQYSLFVSRDQSIILYITELFFKSHQINLLSLDILNKLY